MTDYYGPRAAPAAANTITAGVQTLPRTARLFNNSFVVAWEDRSASPDDSSGSAIRAQRLDSSGNRTGGEILVNTVTAGNQADPSVASLPWVLGGFVVAWTGSDSSGTGIRAQMFTSAGAKSGAEFQVNTTVSDNQSQARAVEVPGVGFVIVWLDHSGTGSAIRGQFYLTSGAKYGNEFVVVSRPGEVLDQISVAPLAQDSRIVVGWTEANGDQDGSAAMTMIVSPTYGALALTRVSEATAGNQLDSAVAAHPPSKGFIVAYVDAAGPGSSGAIKVRMFAADGAALGPSYTIAADGGTDPSVMVYASGMFAVSWRDSAGVLRVQMITGSIDWLGDPLTVSNGTGELATLAPLGNESFLVTWADGDIQTRIFDPSGPAVADIVLSDSALTEGVPEYLPVAVLGATGIGGSSGFSYSIRADSTGGAFGLLGDRLVVRDSTLIDYETSSQVQLTIRATDSQGRYREETLALAIGDAAIEPAGWSAGPLIAANDAEWGPGQPGFAALANGRFVMVYNDSRFDSADSPMSPLRGQVFSASGIRIGPEFEIAVHQDGNQHPAAVAGLAHGGFVVLFANDSSYEQSFGQIFDDDGQAVGERFDVGGGQFNLAVAGLPSGGFVATWSSGWSGSPPTQTVRAQIFDSSGDKLGAEIVVPPTTVRTQVAPTVAVLEGGHFVIAWVEDDLGGDSTKIYAQRFDAGGGRVGGLVHVSQNAADYKSDPSVTGLAGGGFAVTWTEGVGYGSGNSNPFDVRGRVFDASGAPVAGDFLVNDELAGGQRMSVVVALKDGGFVVTWNEHASPDGQNRVEGVTKARMFNAEGDRVGGEFAINQEFAEEHFYTAATALPWGGFVVGYGDYSGSTPGFTSTVKARVIGPTGFDAKPDHVATDEATVLVGNLLADNGDGADVAPPAGTAMVEWVNGSAAAIGKTITLGSGALLTVEADGTFSYDPNHVFDGLALYGSGGSNQQAIDSFTYRLAGGDTATVTVTVRGLYSTPHNVLAGPDGGLLVGSGLADIFVGGQGNDIYAIGAGDSITDFGMGIDTVRTALPNYTLPGGVETLIGTHEGTAAGQVLIGNARNNLIVGTQAHDLLWGNGGGDMMVGGGGLDDFVGGSGADLLIGGSLSSTNLVVNGGFETQDGANASRAYILASPTVDPGLLSRTAASLWGWASPNGAVRLETMGTGNSIPFNSGDGAAILNLVTPGAGYRTIYQDIGGLAAGATLLLTFATGWPPLGNSSAPIEVLWNGAVVGSFASGETAMKEYGLLLTAAEGGNRLGFRPSEAVAGADAVVIDKVELRVVTAAAAAATARYDAGLDGGSGRVLVNLGDSEATLDGIVVAARHGRDTNGEIDSYFNIRNVRTPDAGDNWVLGSDAANELFGGSGIDVLDGGGGDDRLTGNAGDDRLDGGLGNDLLDGGPGVDFVRGGAGDDVYLVDAGDLIFESANSGIDEVRTALASFSLQFFQLENLTATSDSAHQFRGNSAANVLTGGGGNDVLNLRDGGEDRAFGGGGSDLIYFGGALSSGDIADGGEGRDALVLQGNVTAVLGAAQLVGIESISLQTGANPEYGDTGDNRYDYDLTMADGNVAAGQQLIVNAQSLLAGEDFTFDGSAETDGSFRIYGGHGIDLLTGGDGYDIFFFEGQRWGASDRVHGGEGRDSLVISAGGGVNHIAFADDSFTSIESISLNNKFATDPTQKPSYELVLANGNVAPGATLIVNGSSIATATQFVSIDGSAVHDGFLKLFGGAGDDMLIGGAGGDALNGGGGADTLLGGGGPDRLTGGAGADIFRYDSATDTLAGLADQILAFENSVDKIDLSRIDANTLRDGNQAFQFIGSNPYFRTGMGGGGEMFAGALRVYESGDIWIVEGDTNGDAVSDFILYVAVVPSPTDVLQQYDFIL
ncbi:MAG TPA: M10 family metallopeptidase C-terminal domain-containing protein [Allosphingosinicella sp.]|jgi:Ca2+-binding RTX toxin-like protein